jgi:AcrR family transcriptional regulator
MVIRASRRERKHAAVRAQILEAALHLFVCKGLEAVTVDEIAEAADVGKGTIYNYFATKEDIVVAFMVEMEKKVQAKVSGFLSMEAPLDEVLAEFIRFQLRLKKPYFRFVRVLMGQMFVRTEQLLPYMVEMQKVIDPPLQELFEGLRERELMRPDVAIAELILCFKTIHMGISSLWAIEGPPFKQTEKTLKQEMKLFCEGLRSRT